jgi:catechol 2,3-dioxygenase-like lactoylglutathione lyase family enzyme
MINSIHHIGIFTNNPRELTRFYTEKIGFRKEATKIVPGTLMKEIFDISTSCKLTKLKYGQIVIEIISPQDKNLKQKENYASGYNHWSLGVEDKEVFCQELIKKGVSIMRVENKGRYVCFVKDPDGNLIEIYEPREGIQNA